MPAKRLSLVALPWIPGGVAACSEDRHSNCALGWVSAPAGGYWVGRRGLDESEGMKGSGCELPGLRCQSPRV